MPGMDVFGFNGVGLEHGERHDNRTDGAREPVNIVAGEEERGNVEATSHRRLRPGLPTPQPNQRCERDHDDYRSERAAPHNFVVSIPLLEYRTRHQSATNDRNPQLWDESDPSSLWFQRLHAL
jgi:hypothetical protein